VVVLFAGATAFLFLWPEEDELPARADAIVVLSGGSGERVGEGVRLWRAGVAPVLALSNGRAEDEDEATRHCDRPGVECFVPEPFSTQGEARWIAREARRRGWGSVVLVTSTYHLRRARMIVDRCFEGELAAVGSQPRAAIVAIGIAWEWPKSLYYLTLNRDC
jgi:uncharacterized SAM-binding protein YcdF (DUF218 family)